VDVSGRRGGGADSAEGGSYGRRDGEGFEPQEHHPRRAGDDRGAGDQGPQARRAYCGGRAAGHPRAGVALLGAARDARRCEQLPQLGHLRVVSLRVSLHAAPRARQPGIPPAQQAGSHGSPADGTALARHLPGPVGPPAAAPHRHAADTSRTLRQHNPAALRDGPGVHRGLRRRPGLRPLRELERLRRDILGQHHHQHSRLRRHLGADPRWQGALDGLAVDRERDIGDAHRGRRRFRPATAARCVLRGFETR
jgi:hypothetical protein